MAGDEITYLGFDFSTQQLKGVITNDSFKILHEVHVQFDKDLPEFRTRSGVIRDPDGCTVTAPTVMWVKALDLVLEKLRLAGADFSSVASLSGTAQQHGSVYWQRGARDVLRCLQPSQFLHQQLAACFSLHCAPVWMDSSTTVQCRALERAVGGGRRMAEITGSTAYERFTASQIAKLYQKRPSIYNNTERISLVSSFACSLLLGDYADIDHSDGSGMNLLDIHSKQWCNTLLDATAPDLVSKLGYPVPSYSVQGTVSKYFVERFDFSPDCKVVSFTGDNPASLVGMRLREGDVAVSLGTSDTVFLPLRAPKTLLEGHVLCSPLEHDAFMALLCFKNGSKTRERIRDKFADGLWTIFDELLENTPRGNFGNMALFYDVREIIPFAMGEYRFNKHDEPLSRFTSHEVEIRALVEGQFVAKRAHAEDMGFHLDSNSRIIATGGASNNKAILQVLSDVFNAPVYVLESANSAVLGAAYQAKYGLVADNMTFQEMTECIPPPQQACCPYADAAQVYSPMVKRYRKIIATIANEK